MDLYFNRQGHPINGLEFSRLFSDRSYQMLDQTVVGAYRVSTIWLGIDHGFGDSKAPIIFETMVFSNDEWEDKEHRGLQDIDGRRYATEDEAVTGHREMVELIQATTIEIPTEVNDVDLQQP